MVIFTPLREKIRLDLTVIIQRQTAHTHLRCFSDFLFQQIFIPSFLHFPFRIHLWIPWARIQVRRHLTYPLRWLRELSCRRLCLRQRACLRRLRGVRQRVWGELRGGPGASGLRERSQGEGEGTPEGSGCPRWWGTSSSASRRTAPWRNRETSGTESRR